MEETASFPLPHVSHDLTGQVALVTGASAGLGRRFALVLAAAGARVGVCARRVERLTDLVAEIEALGGQAVAVELDVADADAIRAAVQTVEDTFGLVTILVNNAGIPDARRAHRMDVELVDTVLATNLRGPWLLATEVAGRLIAAERPGRIVNLSSMGAFHTASAGSSLYSVTKAAINRMTEVLAVEWAAARINVNAIAPGSFRSEMTEGLVERVGDYSATFPRARWGEPAHLDSTLLHLVGPASECVTGTVVKVDDGQLPR